MRIGFIQLAPVLGNMEATIRKIDGFLRRGQAADLLVLPELCNSGYNFHSPQQAWETSEETEHSEFIRYLQSRCREFDLHVVSGFNERGTDGLYNSAVLVGPEGLLARYRKIHLFMNEKDIFKPGNLGLPVIDLGPVRIGMLVCFDWVFPEVWRILALQGADIVCHPSNLVLPGFAQRVVPAHALLNALFVVTSNRVGSEGDLTFTGLSTIADPKGNVIVQASRTQEELRVIEVDISMARDKMITPRNDLLRDRRPREYSLLIEEITKEGREKS
ncbi:MAG: carbon-nitrogen hydrolase [Deltaproteobacteria bacterium]|nr:carbon-nitrogen hydrolase [Deltaproteobacteria bacterium]